MNKVLSKLGLGVAAAAMAITAAAPAEAQHRGGYGGFHGGYGGYHGGYGYRGYGGAAVVGGLLGLGIGAAIASDRGYGYYGPGYGYYGGPGYYRPACWTSFRWDPYHGRRIPVRVCR